MCKNIIDGERNEKKKKKYQTIQNANKRWSEF